VRALARARNPCDEQNLVMSKIYSALAWHRIADIAEAQR